MSEEFKNEIDTNGENQDLTDSNNDQEKNNLKVKGSFNKIIKIVLLVAILAGGFFLFWTNTGGSSVNLILSASEIISNKDIAIQDKFKSGGKIYFNLKSKEEKFGVDIVIIKIDKADKNEYKYYKKITYEIESDFSEIKSSIPGEYFKVPGEYKISLFFNRNIVESKEISIIQ